MLAAIQANLPAGPLLPAVAVSVALHVAVLMGLPDWTPLSPEAPRAPLNARISPADAPPALEPAVTREGPEPERAKPAAAPARESAQRRPPPEQRSPRPVVPLLAAVRDTDAPAPVALPDPAPSPTAAASRSEQGAAGGEPSAVPRAGPDAVDLGSLSQYRLALIGTARQHKLYPSYAIERGWQGRVSIELQVAADGTLSAASVKRSSGHEVLDRQAVEMLRKAVALTPVPPALRSREFRIDVPVLFELASGPG